VVNPYGRPDFSGLRAVFYEQGPSFVPFRIWQYELPKRDGEYSNACLEVVLHNHCGKRYASKKAFGNYRHEAAYLLIKGNPAFPATPLDDVRDWVYSGNELHPTQKSIHILKP
jgi:hypothetical protein